MAEDHGRRRERTLVELHKEGMKVRLLRLAVLRTRSPQDAEDLVQTALAKVFNLQDSPWDPDGSVSFFIYVGSVINGLAANAQRSWRSQHEVIDSNLARDDKAVDPGPLALHRLGDAHEEIVRRGRFSPAPKRRQAARARGDHETEPVRESSRIWAAFRRASSRSGARPDRRRVRRDAYRLKAAARQRAPRVERRGVIGRGQQRPQFRLERTGTALAVNHVPVDRFPSPGGVCTGTPVIERSGKSSLYGSAGTRGSGGAGCNRCGLMERAIDRIGV
jgi:DNA-directed RNA polymerase specialized sigma24 family protein